MSALTDEAREWRKTALPPEPWGDDHIVLRLAAEVDSLTAQLQRAEAMIAEALSYFEDGAPEGAARLLRRADTSALVAVKAGAWDEGGRFGFNRAKSNADVRTSNPYRASIEQGDREPQPEDGPDYHAEHAAWERRQPVTPTENGENTHE